MAAKKNSTQAPPKGRRFQPGKSGNPKGRPKGSKNRPSTLPVAEAVAAAQLARKGHSASAIARLLDAKPEAVKDALANARKLLDQFAPEMARYFRIAAYRAAKRGDHRPAFAALQSTKVIEPIAQTYDTGNGKGAAAIAGVKVELHGFYCAGLPGLPQGLVPQSDAEPVTVNVTARSGT
jgi:hypothetical protein